jgi:outer membrane protein OmpA-like peptidoglycan-associated protein
MPKAVLAAPLLAAILLAGASPAALAQGAGAPRPGILSAEQIIAALRPVGAIQAGTRGIRPVGPLAGSAAAPAAAAGAAPSQPVRTAMAAKPPAVDLTVHFEFGSAEITPRAARALDELGRALVSASLAGYRFRIEGHTDTVGTPEFNKNLSDQRAYAVARYLEDRFAVGATRLETVGLGDRMLLVATPPQTPEERNRRVHVVNLGT